MTRRTITIPAPVVTKHGQRVLVLNYRIKTRRAWEPGTLNMAPEFHFGGGWHYRVMLDRRGKVRYPGHTGDPIFLTVGDDGIEKL